MSKRNLFWLVATITAGVVVGVIAGWLWGIVAAVVVLTASEVIERVRRRKLRAASGVEGSPSVKDAITQRRRKR